MRYDIHEDGDNVEIRVIEPGNSAPRVLALLQDCQEGRCGCPTDEYQKLQSMQVAGRGDDLVVSLTPYAGQHLDPDCVSSCMDHTLAAAAEPHAGTVPAQRPTAGRAAPTTYRVTASTTADGVASVHAADRTIGLDAAWAAPPSGDPGPADLLASAFAACLLKNLARAGHLLDFDYRDATVEVTARRQDSPPKFVEVSYALVVTTDEPQRRVDLLHHNLRKYGTVYNTLAAVCDVHGTVTARHPAEATP